MNGSGDTNPTPTDPCVVLDDDGTLDDFCAVDVKLVHFEATDDADWYATIELVNGEIWQLNFGAFSPKAKGYARADKIWSEGER